jgi:pyruvate dehydrogenase E2 component (dihydrolipoamide acetyltransferase)
MVSIVRLPQMSDTMTEGTIVQWLVDEGADVRTGDPLLEVETDKAVMEVESSGSGVLLRRYVAEGDEAPCGSALAAVGEIGEVIPEMPDEVPALPQEELAPPRDEPVVQPVEPVQGLDEPVVQQTDELFEQEEPVSRQEELVLNPEELALSLDTVPDLEEAVIEEQETPHSDTVPASERVRPRISPAARKLARERGVDIAGVAGTGPGGRIVKRDVSSAVTVPDVAEVARGQVEPYSSRRKTMIRRLEEVASTVPVFSLRRTISMDAAHELREGLRQTHAFASGVSYNALLVRAVAMAMDEEPGLLGRYTSDGIERPATVDVGLAVESGDVVVVPVIRGCDRRDLASISMEMDRLINSAREGRLSATDQGGGSFSISNLGMYGVDEFTAMINTPDGGILAVGAVREAPVVRQGQVGVGLVMTVTLTVDHRVCDGAPAARWLGKFARLVENPLTLLVDHVPIG